MSTWGIAMVKDEIDILRWTLPQMLCQVDEVLVADNGSTDGTRELLEDMLDRYPTLHVIDDPEVAYYQARKMTAMAGMARLGGADWVVPFDADEVWYSGDYSISETLEDLPIHAVARAALYDHRRVVGEDDDTDPNPLTRMGWRTRAPGGLPKVAVRTCLRVNIEMGNHGAHYLDGTIEDKLVVRHFPYRSADQFVTKARNGAAAYAATEGLGEHIGAHWRDYGRILDNDGEDALRGVFEQHFSYPDRDAAIRAGMMFDPSPLQ